MHSPTPIPKYFKQLLLMTLVGITMGGCSISNRTDLAPFEQDQLAKTFQIPPGRANLYLLRNERTLSRENIRIIINSTEIGMLSPDTYLLTRVKPNGIYEIKAELLGNIYAQKIQVELNRNFFIDVRIINKSPKPRVQISLLSNINGRTSVVKMQRVASTLIQIAPK